MTTILDDFLVNLAAGLAYDLLKAGAVRLRDLALGAPAQRALQRSYQAAFAVMLQRVGGDLDQSDIQLIADIFHEFVADPATANALFYLALGGSPAPDLAQLRERFDALDYDRTTLRVDFDRAMAAFHGGLTEALVAEAGEPDSPLYNQVSLARLLAVQSLLRGQQASLEQLSQQVQALPREMRQAVEAAVEAELQGRELSQPQLPDDIATLVAEIRTLLATMREWQRVAAEQSRPKPAVPARPPLTDIRRRYLEDQLREGQEEYVQLTGRVAALKKDVSRELDSERRLILQQRLDDVEATRRKLVEQLASHQQQLGLPVGPPPSEIASVVGVNLQNVHAGGNINISGVTVQNITWQVSPTQVLPPPIQTHSDPAAPSAKASAEAIQVFLSYGREDFEQVSALYDNLITTGFRPWMDKRDLLPGQQWEIAIRKTLKQSDFIVICLSSRSANKGGFLQREIKFALDLSEEMLDEDIYIIPVRLEYCDMPDRLRKFHWLDLFEPDGWIRLEVALRAGMDLRGSNQPSS